MRDEPEMILSAENAQEFSFDEFTYYFDIAIAAGEMSMPVENPEQSGVGLEMEDGSIQQIRFVDQPMNRAALAVKKEMNDPKKFTSFIWRFWGVMELIQSNKLGEWAFDDPEEVGVTKIHPAVFDVARKMSMNKEGKFNISSFIKSVEESPVEPD